MAGVTGVLYQSGLSIKFKWEIPNFLSLSFSESKDYYTSKRFSFENTSYTLWIYGAHLWRHCHSVWINCGYSIPSYVTCSLSIQKSDGTYFVTETTSFTSDHRFENFINTSLLQQNKSELLPANTLTIVCVLERDLRLNRRGAQIANSFNKRRSVKDSKQKKLAGSAVVGAKPATKNVRRTSTFGLSNRTAGGVIGVSTQSAYYHIFRKKSPLFGTPLSRNPARFRVCSYCGDNMDFKPISLHDKKCRYRPIKCPRCSNFVLLKYWNYHKCPNAGIEDKASMPVSASIFRENKILEDYRELFLKQKDCDVIIKVKDQQFQVHRAILNARSSILQTTLRNDKAEKTIGIINIENCDDTSFSDYLCFLYCGDTNIITETNVFSLFTIADKYNVEDLRNSCREFIKKTLSVDTICKTITLAFQFSETELINLANDFFSKNLLNIIVTHQWQSLLAENPKLSNEMLIKALVTDKHSTK